jgi:SAM-dependent methyltransferase
MQEQQEHSREPFLYTTDDTLRLLDELLAARDGSWWDGFFSDRAKPCPFFVDWPDENLLEWFDQGRIGPGRVLELGSGHGRNAVFLAGRGWSVDAVDFSSEAIEWAAERAEASGVAVNFQSCDIFDATFAEGAYDLVYDSGCFHHLAPHRRPHYVELVRRALKPGGHFGLVCFRPEGGGGYTDREVYQNWSLGGGLGYSEAHLRALWDEAPFSVDVLRQMRKTGGQGPAFGEDFLWALLARRSDAQG